MQATVTVLMEVQSESEITSIVSGWGIPEGAQVSTVLVHPAESASGVVGSDGTIGPPVIPPAPEPEEA